MRAADRTGSDRQLCITLAHPVSPLLDTTPACKVHKSPKTRRIFAYRPNVFQDRCRQPLGYLSARSFRAARAYLGRDGSSKYPAQGTLQTPDSHE